VASREQSAALSPAASPDPDFEAPIQVMVYKGKMRHVGHRDGRGRRKGRTRFLVAAMGLALMPSVARGQVFDWDEPYLMSMTICSSGPGTCSTPDQHHVVLADSNDGATWNVIPGWGVFFYQGSVPDVIRRGDTVYIFTPNEVARYNLVTGIWMPPVPVSLTDPATTGGFVDPSAYVDRQGRLVLFYLLGIIGQDPAGCGGAASCTKYIHSATEVPGSDGTAFVVNPGHRLTVPTGGGEPPISSDPDIIRVGDEFIVLLSRGTSTQLWTSSSLHGTYRLSTSLPGGYLWHNGPAVASGFHFESTGEFWFFGHEFSATYATKVLRRAIVSTIDSPVPSSAWVTVIQPNDLGLSNATELGSPGFALNSTPTFPTGAAPCPTPNRYCTSAPHSAGAGALISWSGSTTISDNAFSLVCTNLPGSQFGLFYYGPNQASAPFGDGFSCISGSIYRFAPISTGSGSASWWVDFTAPPSLAGEITPASTWNFQFWFRDPAGLGAGFNLSDALEVTFCP
jgi:hypothetical protein